MIWLEYLFQHWWSGDHSFFVLFFYCCSIQRQLYGCYYENIPFYILHTITTTNATITMIIFNNFSKVERVTMIIKVFAQVERVTRETEGNSLTALVNSPDGELQVLIFI